MIQIKFFTIPDLGCRQSEDELNLFLRSHRVISVDKEYNPGMGHWSFSIQYSTLSGNQSVRGEFDSKKPKVDYREILSGEDFEKFDSLRKWRKEVSDKKDIPVFRILTNENLADIVRKKCRTLSDLKKVDGIGDSRLPSALHYGRIPMQVRSCPDRKYLMHRQNY